MKKFSYAVIITLLLTSCSRRKAPVLAPEYLFHEKDQKVITSLINNKQGTIAIIYGNQRAMKSAMDSLRTHVPGEHYVMVTWKQRPMPHWYGTNMNGPIISVETVNVLQDSLGKVLFDYRSKSDSGIELISKDNHHKSRVNFITGQPAAVFP